MEYEVIRGPVVPGGGQLIYQVTLSQGLVLTNPASFGPSDPSPGARFSEVVTESGYVLRPV